LQLVAESARRSIRASDVVARLGRDSFAVLLPEASPEAADTVIRKLQQSLRDASRETALPLCISGGVVTCVQPAESLEAVISAADRLLSGAKDAGNDTFWCEVIAPQPLEAFEPARLRRPFRLPPGFDMPPPLRRLYSRHLDAIDNELHRDRAQHEPHETRQDPHPRLAELCLHPRRRGERDVGKE